MKNQYVGDIGDYGKYGLLRFMRDAGLHVGVNWYLTPDDGRTDGCHTEYLADPRMRTYDPHLYDTLQQIAFRPDKSVQMVEQSTALDGMRFYNTLQDLTPLPWQRRTGKRSYWHRNALRELEDADIVFLDPDNGLSSRRKPTQKDTQKFVIPNEIVDYFERGQQVVYYHHRSRGNAVKWLGEKRQMQRLLPQAKLLAVSFHRWSARAYVFVLQDDQFEWYQHLIEDFLATAWGTYVVDGKVAFTTEEV